MLEPSNELKKLFVIKINGHQVEFSDCKNYIALFHPCNNFFKKPRANLLLITNCSTFKTPLIFRCET